MFVINYLIAQIPFETGLFKYGVIHHLRHCQILQDQSQFQELDEKLLKKG